MEAALGALLIALAVVGAYRIAVSVRRFIWRR